MMNDATGAIEFTRRIPSKAHVFSLDVEMELAESDQRIGHEYLPMDIYVDPITIERHFQVASVYARIHRRHPNGFH